jgi:hypothetical protein
MADLISGGSRTKDNDRNTLRTKILQHAPIQDSQRNTAQKRVGLLSTTSRARNSNSNRDPLSVPHGREEKPPALRNRKNRLPATLTTRRSTVTLAAELITTL